MAARSGRSRTNVGSPLAGLEIESFLPAFDLAGNPVGLEARSDLAIARGMNRVARVAAKIGAYSPHDVPTGPSSPFPGFAAMAPDPVGQMLIVDAGVPQKEIIRCPGDDPGYSAVGQGPALDNVLISLKRSEQGAINRQQAAGRGGVQPEVLTVFQAPEVERRPPVVSALMQVPPIQFMIGTRQKRAGSGTLHRVGGCWIGVDSPQPFFLGVESGMIESRD